MDSTILNEILKRPIIPVIVIEDADDAVPLAEALLEGGMDIVEVTFRTDAAVDAIQRIAKAFPTMLLGAGTILTEQQAQQALDAGVQFGLAPGLNPEVVNFFRSSGVLFIPGVMTPTEIEKGLSLGCKLQKFFPAGLAGGVKMLQALAGPYSGQELQFCPTGGVNLDNMNDYLSLPIVSNIGGSWLATKQQIAEKQWAVITGQVKAALSKV